MKKPTNEDWFGFARNGSGRKTARKACEFASNNEKRLFPTLVCGGVARTGRVPYWLRSSGALPTLHEDAHTPSCSYGKSTKSDLKLDHMVENNDKLLSAI
ncbi:hypothetical protein HZH68_010171 [Vespula germanica]|uniref:Uncharacterized protein n=1 Tax=Vespula germanica TaxID=30212 RepID=A0A834JS79_VESGE|nr:hypothetical protein HZH68_010171 [Vespula germanica]